MAADGPAGGSIGAVAGGGSGGATFGATCGCKEIPGGGAFAGAAVDPDPLAVGLLAGSGCLTGGGAGIAFAGPPVVGTAGGLEKCAFVLTRIFASSSVRRVLYE